MQTNEQFIRACGKYKRVEDIPQAEREEMLKRINADEIDGHRRRSKIHNRIYQAKRKKAGHAQQSMA